MIEKQRKVNKSMQSISLNDACAVWWYGLITERASFAVAVPQRLGFDSRSLTQSCGQVETKIGTNFRAFDAVGFYKDLCRQELFTMEYLYLYKKSLVQSIMQLVSYQCKGFNNELNHAWSISEISDQSFTTKKSFLTHKTFKLNPK